MIQNIHAIIIARGGSKGIPNKNIIQFCGQPLIVWTIKQCLKSKYINEIWVSSDSDKILDLANSFNVNTIKRPKEYSSDKSSSEDAWLHAIDYIENLNQKIDLVVAPQVTSPLRESDDFDNAINIYFDKGYDSLFSASLAEDLFFWKAKHESLYSVNYDFRTRKRRQDIEKQVIENGSFYLFSPELVRKTNNRLGGKIGFSEMPFWKMFEIDNHEDIRICSAIMREFLLKD